MMLGAGTKLGPYEIVAPLGAGGMGEVYRAKDSRLDRTVAVKVLPAQVASDPDFRQRFEREAKTLAALSHPHICPVFDVGQQDGIDFLVMEYLEGQTLASRLEKGALPLEPALQSNWKAKMPAHARTSSRSEDERAHRRHPGSHPAEAPDLSTTSRYFENDAERDA